MDYENGNILVDAHWLKMNMGSKDLIIVDCRYNLIDREYGIREYEKGRIPGSYFLELEAHLTGEKDTHTGRHPLPEAENFAAIMNSMGLRKDTTVVAYDDESSGSARLWWLLKYFGHDRALILDGGIRSWIDAGYELSREAPEKSNGNFKPSVRKDMVVNLNQLKSRINELCIIDSRSPERYRGEIEPIDPVAGHIPGSLNIDYQSNLDSHGKYLPGDILKEKFSGIEGEPVVYCGSGVTACVNIVAMSIAGRKVFLYPGGWSQWVSYKEHPVEKGNR